MLISKCLLVSVLYCAVVTAKTSLKLDSFSDIRADPPINYRLPNNAEPSAYDLEITTNIHNNVTAFKGKVTITLKVKENSTSITLHARQLIIGPIKLSDNSDGISIKYTKTYDNVTEFLKITPNDAGKLIENHIYTLSIDYTGDLRDDQKGFYKSTYKDKDGNIKMLATTQFESTDARHGFPCFDEPHLKAKFTISINHGKTYNAISNMPLAEPPTESTEGTDMVRSTFEITPLMSTYLVAYIISDFTYVENATVVTPRQRVYTHEEYKNQTSYALSEGIELIKAIAEFVNVPYALSKMDQAAIPDFAAGAMENWGLVTYRETSLLYDDKVHSALRQLRVSAVISHEFAHQWFGNLVTPKWWSYIWLNEGFATLFENLGTDLVHPDRNMFDYFVVNDVHNVLRIDARPETRPMTHNVESQADIANLFDRIAYDKSGAVIRMFMHALGQDTFKKGLNYYLKNNSYKAVDENDLFVSLNAAAKEDNVTTVDVADLFSSWSQQVGFPLVTVKRNGDGSLKISQEKYTEQKDDKKAEENKTQWWIPYTFVTGKNRANMNKTAPDGWVPKANETIDHEGEQLSNDDWVIFNPQQTGYYRVLYDAHNYALLWDQLKTDHSVLHPTTRAQLIDDLLDFAYTDRIDTKHLYNFLKYLENDIDYAPWAAAKRAITDLRLTLSKSNRLPKLKTVFGALAGSLYNKVSVDLNNTETEPLLNKFLRTISVNLACEYEVPACLDDTLAKFTEFVDNNQELSQHHRGIVLANGIRKATNEQIDKLWAHFENITDADVRMEIIASLANIKNETVLESYLKKSIEESTKEISNDERLSIITTIATRQAGPDMAIQFLNEADVLKKISTLLGNGSVKKILQSIAGRFVNTEDQTKLYDPLVTKAKTDNVISEDDVKSLTETVTSKVAWQKGTLKRIELGLDNSIWWPHNLSGGASKLAVFPTMLIALFWIVHCLNN